MGCLGSAWGLGLCCRCKAAARDRIERGGRRVEMIGGERVQGAIRRHHVGVWVGMEGLVFGGHCGYIERWESAQKGVWGFEGLSLCQL